MLIGNMIKELFPGEKIEVYQEQEIEGLGLNNYGPNKPYCTFAESEEYLKSLAADVVEVITIKALQDIVIKKNMGCIIADNPKDVFFCLHDYLARNAKYLLPVRETKIDETAEIDGSAIISDKNVRIGKGVRIGANVIIESNVTVSDGTVIHAGTIIGAQDLEVKSHFGKQYRVAHAGNVIIRENTVIGYNNVIGKAVYPWDNTVIGRENHTGQGVVIGHGAKLGTRITIASCVVVSGRVSIGDDVWIGPGAVLSNGLAIGQKAYLSIGSVVIKNIPEKSKVFGNPGRIMPL